MTSSVIIVSYILLSVCILFYGFVGIWTVDKAYNPKMLELWNRVIFPFYVVVSILTVILMIWAVHVESGG